MLAGEGWGTFKARIESRSKEEHLLVQVVVGGERLVRGPYSAMSVAKMRLKLQLGWNETLTSRDRAAFAFISQKKDSLLFNTTYKFIHAYLLSKIPWHAKQNFHPRVSKVKKDRHFCKRRRHSLYSLFDTQAPIFPPNSFTAFKLITSTHHLALHFGWRCRYYLQQCFIEPFSQHR